LPWQRPLDPRYSAMSSLDSLSPKTQARIKHRVASCHTAEVISIQSLPAPAQTPRGQPISEVGGETPPCLVWTSSHSHRLTLYCFRFPDFPHIRNGGAQSVNFGSANRL